MEEIANISIYYQAFVVALRDKDTERMAKALDKLELSVVRARKELGLYGPIDRFDA